MNFKPPGDCPQACRPCQNLELPIPGGFSGNDSPFSGPGNLPFDTSTLSNLLHFQALLSIRVESPNFRWQWLHPGTTKPSPMTIESPRFRKGSDTRKGKRIETALRVLPSQTSISSTLHPLTQGFSVWLL